MNSHHDGKAPAERPILFSGPMVRALLDGRKTQTRRIVKPQPSDYRAQSVAPQASRGEPPKNAAPYFDAYNGGPHWCWWDEYNRQGPDWIKCPYGTPGDTLWVRETFCPADTRSGFAYCADTPLGSDQRGMGWRSSIHMPRQASRLTLNITDVRCERLQDISRRDAIAEGLYRSLPDDADRDWFLAHTQEQSGTPPTTEEWETFNAGVWMVPGVPQGWGRTLAERRKDTWGPSPEFCYRLLWEHINGKHSWAANPWVWALTFDVQVRR